ncbi:MAG: glycogen synthase GlgA [Candidatus Adiutrix intracellularis]|nr:glycogen synthase GlgA [Candidatus Adiutrix intracellularis]
MPSKKHILIASPEVRPLAQTGGLADVAGSLPAALVRQGVETAVIMPAYQSVLQNKAIRLKETGIRLVITQADQIIEGFLLHGELTPGIPAYLIGCDQFFNRPGLYDCDGIEYPDNPERFTFFCKAVLQVLPHLANYPDIILANDWQTGLIMPLLIIQGLDRPRGVFIIHNQGYLGLTPHDKLDILGLPPHFNNIDGLEYYGQSSLLKAGIVFSRALVTVSPTYAKEIQTPEGGHGLDGTIRHHAEKLRGILNGVDYTLWNPKTDRYLPAHYSARSLKGKRRCKETLLAELNLTGAAERPLVVMVTRLTAQKGITLVAEAAADLFHTGLNLIILGSGEPFYENMIRGIEANFPSQYRSVIGYDEALSHQLIAGADMILIPSIYEPCGLVQLYALKYGTVPIVRAVGGLNDTVRDFAGTNPKGLWDTGFKFTQFQARALILTTKRAIDLYNRPRDFTAMVKAGMKEDFSWDNSARQYLKLFEKVLAT